MRNIIADTEMREALAGKEESGTATTQPPSQEPEQK